MRHTILQKSSSKIAHKNKALEIRNYSMTENEKSLAQL